MKYIFDKKTGKFIKDPNIISHGKRNSILFYTGSVLILEDLTFDKATKKYTGYNNGNKLTIRPSEIINMEAI